jgi:thioredoxin 1
MRGRTFLIALRALVVGVAMVAAGAAAAFERTPYSNALVEQARAAGRPYIIYVHADWCTTCQAQDRILAPLVDDPRFADLLILTVDFDTKRNLMMLFNVDDRSTFVAFHGTTELQRSWGDTTPEGIEQFLIDTMAGSPDYVTGTMPPLPPPPAA